MSEPQAQVQKDTQASGAGVDGSSRSVGRCSEVHRTRFILTASMVGISYPCRPWRAPTCHVPRATDLQEFLRDIDVNLRAQGRRLYHMGFRCQTISRNTLFIANATRPLEIYADFAKHLIGIARPLYATEPLDLELDATVYAFDASTIDLCQSLFAWAPFRSATAVIMLHRLLSRNSDGDRLLCSADTEQQLLVDDRIRNQ